MPYKLWSSCESGSALVDEELFEKFDHRGGVTDLVFDIILIHMKFHLFSDLIILYL